MDSHALRQQLLCAADHDAAARLAERVTDQANQLLNDAEVNTATSLLARALAARGVQSVAAAWWSDLTKAPEPETFKAIRSVIDDLPPQFDPVCFIDPELVGRRHG